MSSDGIPKAEHWYHLSFTWDKDSNEGRIYLDGEEMTYRSKYNEDLSGDWQTAAHTANGLFYLGRDPMPPYDDKLKEDQHRYFYGLLDELALFNDVLSESELEDIRQDTVAAHIGSRVKGLGLLALWMRRIREKRFLISQERFLSNLATVGKVML